MPASMMIAVTGSMPNVSGKRIAIVAAGPRPGSTPISMPMTTPIRQYSRFVGSRTTPKPSSTGVRSTGDPPRTCGGSPVDLTPVLDGFGVVLEPTNLLYCLIGVVIGMLIGVLPGLGPAATIAILLPLTFGIEPVTAIIMLAGIFYGAQYGGTITSVLLRLPGEASSVLTVFDGYALAKQGRAGTALGIAAVGSFVGGTAAIIGLTLLAPIVAGFALDFGPPEYTALAMLGILLVATVSNGSKAKALIAAGLGLLLATVGRDIFTGESRFTFGSL